MAVVNWFFISASMTCKDKFIMVYVRYTAYSFLFKWHILSKLYAPQAVGGVAQMILKIPHPPCSKPNSTLIWRRKVECRKNILSGIFRVCGMNGSLRSVPCDKLRGNGTEMARCWPNVGLLSVHRLRRWPNSKPALDERLVRLPGRY